MPQLTGTQEANPFILRDLSKCILCGKCIRADHELVAVGALDYVHRGFDAKPATLFDGPLESSECTFCGTCVTVCPTGALFERSRPHLGTIGSRTTSTCSYCGCGCSIFLESHSGRLVTVAPNPKNSSNGNTLCVKGHYGTDYIHHPDRLKRPMLRKNGELHECDWDEALANIRTIILDGADSYASLETERSKGTKIFSLAGKVNNTGLVEVPIGITMREVIYEVGGGIPKGRRFKAVQMGGPSGGCVPARHLDLPIDYDSLQAIGSIMGSGGMVIMDENNCMVDIARFFLGFTQSESCGKCAPCRLGTTQMLSILDRITRGEGVHGDIERLVEIGEAVRGASLCGLGQTCANPVLSTIRYFRQEYEAHIQERRCPAASCEGMIISACQHACPAGIDVPNYLAYIAGGKYVEAAELIRERNPFPGICGRICHHPCELKCRRGELDEPMAIRALKRFAADWYYANVGKDPEPFPVLYDQRVAVVGAGPAGLSCAFYLRKMGYRTRVFEALPVGGGMMGVVIPDFRLPKDIIQREIRYIEARGVEIEYNAPITSQRRIENLLKEGFDAVFIAAGAQRSQRTGIPGELEGVDGLVYGLGFLRDLKVGKTVRVGKRVAVIGGGNTAMDAARTARRLKAEEVHVYYRRTQEEMPVAVREYREAVEEGISFHFLTNPTRIAHENWRVKGLECIRMIPGEAETDDYVDKPVETGEIAKRVEALLAKG